VGGDTTCERTADKVACSLILRGAVSRCTEFTKGEGRARQAAIGREGRWWSVSDHAATVLERS
jgi:hypothetical protein